MAAAQVPESVLARIWNDGWRSRDLRTTDGRRAAIIYRGVWTHSNGPDFRDAMLELDGRLVSGAVELHVRSSQWHTHGHHLNPEYDAVVLHVVLDDDAAQHATGPAGRPIPTIAIGPYLHGSLEEYVERFVPLDLGRLGETACLPTLAGGRVDEIRIALRRAGWRRLHEKQLRFQQEMAVLPPSEVLYRGVLDSLGLSANRPGMAAVADGLALDTLDRILASQGETGCLAALLGVAGFLPLSPAHLALIEGAAGDEIVLEESWASLRAEYRLIPLGTSIWNLNRVRPLNHPARRLASMAVLLSICADRGLLARVLDGAQAGAAGWDRWLSTAEPAIGSSRRRQVMVNTLAPFVAAYADVTGDEDLGDRASAIWEEMPGGVDDDVSRKTLRQITGGQRFPVRTALEVQGLHQIGRSGCALLRCFECPIAALAVRHEPALTVS